MADKKTDDAKGDAADQKTGAQLEAKPRDDGPKIPPSAKLVSADEAKLAEEEHKVRDQFAALHGEFLNAVDALGNTHELRMAKSHLHQMMEWIGRHLHPDPSATMPDAPPPVPPAAA
jgi:hypothetical protein